MSLNEVRPRWPEQLQIQPAYLEQTRKVSMTSGLDGRNNGGGGPRAEPRGAAVSMKSGLDGRNNLKRLTASSIWTFDVSMKSGLDGRNNLKISTTINKPRIMSQ